MNEQSELTSVDQFEVKHNRDVNDVHEDGHQACYVLSCAVASGND